MSWSDKQINISWKLSDFPTVESKEAIKRAIVAGLQMHGFVIDRIYSDPGGGSFQVEIKK